MEAILPTLVITLIMLPPADSHPKWFLCVFNLNNSSRHAGTPSNSCKAKWFVIFSLLLLLAFDITIMTYNYNFLHLPVCIMSWNVNWIEFSCCMLFTLNSVAVHNICIFHACVFYHKKCTPQEFCWHIHQCVCDGQLVMFHSLALSHYLGKTGWEGY